MVRQFVVFVEGPDDQRFIEALLTAKLRKRRVKLVTQPYANGKDQARARKLIRLVQQAKIPHIFLCDRDDANCYTARRSAVASDFKVSTSNIVVATPMIEGWYIAGVSVSQRKLMGCKHACASQPDRCDKRVFDSMIPPRFGSRIPFMRDLLKRFDCDLASASSRSFDYAKAKYKKIVK